MNVRECPKESVASIPLSKISSQEDFYMMTVQGGGKERTQNEFMELALGSGFSGIKFNGCFSGNWVMEFYKWPQKKKKDGSKKS